MCYQQHKLFLFIWFILLFLIDKFLTLFNPLSTSNIRRKNRVMIEINKLL